MRRAGRDVRLVLRRAESGPESFSLLGCGSGNSVADPNGNARQLPGHDSARRRPGPFRATVPTGRTSCTSTGVVRSDIRSSFAGLSGTAEGDSADGDPHHHLGEAAARPLAGSRGVHLALRPGRGATRCIRRESPTRTTCAASRKPMRDGKVDFHDDLPGMLLGPLAAHPLRGVPEPRRRHRSVEQQGRHLAARRCRRQPVTWSMQRRDTRQTHHVTCLPDEPGHRQRLQRRGVARDPARLQAT